MHLNNLILGGALKTQYLYLEKTKNKNKSVTMLKVFSNMCKKRYK